MYCISKAVQTDPSDTTITELILPDENVFGVQKTITLETPLLSLVDKLSTYYLNNSIPLPVKNSETECKICDLRFEKRSDWKRHELLHLYEENYERIEPPLISSVQEPLNESMYDLNNSTPTSVQNSETECKICQLRFEKRSDLKKHELLHHCKETYECQICQRLFKTKHNYWQHFSTQHSSETPFKCEECNQGFKMKTSLHRHKFREHGDIGERVPFKCDECDKVFLVEYDLKRHKLSKHTEKGPFQCDVCRKVFKTKNYMKNHMEKYCKLQLKCEICNIKFFTISDLNTHKEHVHDWGRSYRDRLGPKEHQHQEHSEQNIFTPELDQYQINDGHEMAQLIYYQEIQPDTYSGDQNEVLNHLEVSDKMEEFRNNNFGFKISNVFQLPTEIELEDTILESDLTTEMDHLDDPANESELPTEIEELEDTTLESNLPTEMDQINDRNLKLELCNESDELENHAYESDLPTEMEELDSNIESDFPTEVDRLDNPNFKMDLRNEMEELDDPANESELPNEMESNLHTEIDRLDEPNLKLKLRIELERLNLLPKLVSQQCNTPKDEVNLQIDIKDKDINDDVGFKVDEFKASTPSKIINVDEKQDKIFAANLQNLRKPGLIAKNLVSQRITRRDEVNLQIDIKDKSINADCGNNVDEFNAWTSSKIINVDEKQNENFATNLQISRKPSLIAKKFKSQQRITRRNELNLQKDIKDKVINAEFKASTSSKITNVNEKQDENSSTSLQISDKPGLIAKKCRKCNKWFTDLRRLHNHLKYSSKCKKDINTNDSSKHNFTRKLRDRTFNSSQLLKQRQESYHLVPINLQKHHEEVHTIVRNYKCKHCVSFFTSKQHLTFHVEQYCKGTKFNSNYDCKLCQVFFRDEITFQNHKKVHRNCYVSIKKLTLDEVPKIITVNKTRARKVVRKKRKRKRN